MIRRYAEVECDTCGCCCHYSLGAVLRDARADGWIITSDGKQYDTQECYDKRKERQRSSANG